MLCRYKAFKGFMVISPKRLNPTGTLEREMSDAIIRPCILVVASDNNANVSGFSLGHLIEVPSREGGIVGSKSALRQTSGLLERGTSQWGFSTR